jgi:hypothetical protein
MVATVTAVDTLPTATAGAVHTTVDTVGVTDGIMMDGVADGIMIEGVTMGTSLLVVTADSATMADLVTVVDSKVMVAGSRIQDMAAEAVAADPKGHRISRTTV